MESESKITQTSYSPLRIVSTSFLAILLLLAVGYTLGGFVLLPRLAEQELKDYVAQHLDRELRIHDIDFNPLNLSLEIEDVELRERDGVLLFSLQKLSLDLLFRDLLEQKITLTDITFRAPWIHLELDEQGGTNLGRLVADITRLGEGGNQGKEGGFSFPVRFDRVAIDNGALRITDHSLETQADIDLLPINLELKGLVLAADTEGPLDLSARIPGGGSLVWRGVLSLQPLRSSGQIGLYNHKPIHAWSFLQDRLNIEIPDGVFDLTAHYLFGHNQGKTDLVVDQLEIQLTGLSVTRRGAPDPIVRMKKIALSDARFDLDGNRLNIGSLLVSNGGLRVVRQQTLFNWDRIVKRAVASSNTQPVDDDVTPWQVVLQKLRVEDVALEFEDRDLAEPLIARIENLDLALSAQAGQVDGPLTATVEGLHVELSDLSLKQKNTPDNLLQIAHVVLNDGTADLRSQRLKLGQLQLQGGHTVVARERNGQLNWSGIWKKKGGEAEKTQRVDAAQAGGGWQAELESLALNGFALQVDDRSLEQPARIHLSPVNLKLRNIRSDLRQPIGFELDIRVEEGGRIAAKGEVVPSLPSAEIQLDIERLALNPFRGYLQSQAKVALKSGDISIKGELSYGMRGKNSLSYAGRAGAGELLITEMETGEQLFGWKTMDIPSLRLSLEPDELAIEEILLERPLGKFVIAKDLSNNWQQLSRDGQRAGTEREGGMSEPAGRFPVKVGKVSIRDGSLDFADLSLPFEFITHIHELTGNIVGISTDEGARTAGDLKGRVDEYGSVRIKGELAPSDPTGFMDLSMAFKNLEMSSLTPYTTKFVGHKIDSGKLSLDLQYKLKARQLQGENQILIEKIKLGEKVASPDAIDAPLELAIALLQDTEGRIDLGLPVTGDLDNPEFSYGHLVWKALGNLLANIVTAPFRALGAALGVKGEDLDAISFEPGRFDLTPPEEEKLHAVAEILSKRPKLTLEVQGQYDTGVDSTALKEVKFRLTLLKRMGVKLKQGEQPLPISLGDGKTRKALEDLYTQRVSVDKLEQLKASLKQPAKGEKKPDTDGSGRAQSKASGVASEEELYDRLYVELLALEPIPKSSLSKLAQKRSEAIAAFLNASDRLAASRIKLLAPTENKTSVAKNKLVISVLNLVAGG